MSLWWQVPLPILPIYSNSRVSYERCPLSAWSEVLKWFWQFAHTWWPDSEDKIDMYPDPNMRLQILIVSFIIVFQGILDFFLTAN